MALTKAKKKEMVEEYKQGLKNAKALFVVQPKGITPNQASDLKKKLFGLSASFNVVKNTIFKRALKDENIDMNIENGEHAAVFANEDFVAAAKAVNEFITENKNADFKTGLVEGQIITEADFNALSSLPSREVLLAQILSTMQGSVSGFVRVLNGSLSGFTNVVTALKGQKS